MMKKFVSRLLSLLLILMMTAAVVASAETTTVTTSRGGTVTMNITITGGGKNALIGIKTNKAPVTFASAVGGSANDTVPPKSFDGSFVVTNMEGITISPDGTTASGSLTGVSDLVAGDIGTLTFTVNADAAYGTYTVEAYLVSGSTTVNGSVTFTVSERVPGDANEDGSVDILDALLVLKFDCGWDVTLNEANADVNADGSADILDALLLLKYDCGWDVELK